ncbi:acetyl-CoA C-acetyltransferase [Terrisporobacter glycolicus]|nr:acetyl-CoA C-acetyltransferase [Terrisporobacter glycolicus]
MSKVYIVEAKRSALGKFLGTLSTLSPAELAGQVIKAVIEETKIDSKKIDEVVLGNVLSAGHGQNLGRQAAIAGGIPAEVPAYAINILCGSGMKSVMTAYGQIKSGMANLVIAGGVEVMSQAAFTVDGKTRQGNKMGSIQLKDTLLSDGLTDVFNNYHMGMTAENIVEKYSLSRQDQDKLAIRSQEKAIAAVDSNRFKDEIVPIKVKTRKETIEFSKDEYPNRNTSLEKLSTLRPAFKADGSVTAGNASGINDGAAILLIASEKAIKEYNLTPMAEIVSVGQGGVDPSVMGLGPVPAINNAIEDSGLELKNMELLELNEAFAAQALGVITELKEKHNVDDAWFEERMNVNGGAIALGHPLGASGGRIITTLVHEMKKRDLNYGLASLCIGGGMGTAIVIKLAK